MSKIYAVVNAKVVHERGIIFDGRILFEDDTILKYGKSSEIEIPADAEIIDAEGAYVGPGFVDIHVHGANGHQMSTDPIPAAEYLLMHGETTVFATPSGAIRYEPEVLVEYIKTMRAAMRKQKNIKGIFMEGPYFHPDYGANNKLNIWRNKGIKEEDYKLLVDAGGEDIKRWMIAPELEGILPFIMYAKKVNPSVNIAIGHSEATPKQIRDLGRYKPTVLIHAMNATGRVGEPNNGLRMVGPDEYAFQEPDMYCELISDSLAIHVPPDLQRLLIHMKGIDKVCLITDGTAYYNDPPEEYKGVTDINFDQFGGIAGSKLTMDRACMNIMMHTRVGIAEAFLMAATNPAKAVGLYDELGAIDVGKRADLVFVDDRFNVKKVIFNGEIVK